MAPALVVPYRCWATILLALCLASCGGPAQGGSGRLTPGHDGGPARLVVEGTPREQGLWQGQLLREEILAFHEAFQKAALAHDGELLSPATRAHRSTLLGLCEPARQRLPEAARQELEGLSAGCGLPVSTLLLSEMLTDLLRFGSDDRLRLEAQLGGPAPGTLEFALEGPLAAVVQPRLLWITRGAAEGAARVTVLAWPGSLGGLLATRADGLTLAAAEVDLELGRQGLGGVPFDLSLRLAVERATDARGALALLSQTTAHRVAALDPQGGPALEALCALAGDDPLPFTAAALPVGGAAFGVVWRAGAAWMRWRSAQGVSQEQRVP